MVIKWLDELTKEERKCILRRVNILNDFEGRLLDNLELSDGEKLVSILNSINNQGILEINVERYYYIRYGKKLRFGSMSTSEKLFLVAYAADKSRVKVFFCDDILQLDRSTFELFVRVFGRSEYVNVVYRELINSFLKQYKEGK